jgi:hypothetical protein
VRQRRLAVVIVVLAALSRNAAGDPIMHLKTSSEVHTQGGTNLTLPPGYFMDEPTFAAKDAEMRRLQDVETRKNAENESLRKAARKSPWDWRIVSAAFAAGCAVAYLLK